MRSNPKRHAITDGGDCTQNVHVHTLHKFKVSFVHLHDCISSVTWLASLASKAEVVTSQK